MSIDNNHVFDRVKDCIAKALEIEVGTIVMTSRLTGDLGAESIDFLDIVFRLEKAFAIKIPRDDLFPERVLTDAKFVQNGRLTDEGLQFLKAKLFKVDFTAFEQDPIVAKLPDLFTVQMIVDYVERRLQPA